MNKSIFSIIALTIILLSACASETSTRLSGKSITKNVKTPAFERISIEGGMDVYYTQGNVTSVRVEATERDMKRLDIRVEDNQLVIGVKSKVNFSFGSKGRICVYVTTPDIIGVSIAGSGSFYAEKLVDTDKMKISVAGSGDISMDNLICDELKSSIAGSGEVNLKQFTAGKASFSVAGSGDVSVSDANIGFVKSSIAGSGTIAINGVVKDHSESVAGSGEVSVNGKSYDD